MSAPIGNWEDEPCNRNGCAGVIKLEPVENCSCHISPPCSACVDQAAFCPVCEWNSAEEVVINNYVVQVDKDTGAYKSWALRPLDETKIDWRWASHTNSSMIKEGVYPAGIKYEDLLKAINGTFGGRFEYHAKPENGRPGRFKFIAYTD